MEHKEGTMETSSQIYCSYDDLSIFLYSTNVKEILKPICRIKCNIVFNPFKLFESTQAALISMNYFRLSLNIFVLSAIKSYFNSLSEFTFETTSRKGVMKFSSNV